MIVTITIITTAVIATIISNQHHLQSSSLPPSSPPKPPSSSILTPVRTDAGSQLHLIDMGVARRFVQPESKQHIPPQKNLPFVGTCRYAGVHAHEGVEQVSACARGGKCFWVGFVERFHASWRRTGWTKQCSLAVWSWGSGWSWRG